MDFLNASKELRLSNSAYKKAVLFYVWEAYKHDLNSGDITTKYFLPNKSKAIVAEIVSNEDGILAGMEESEWFLNKLGIKILKKLKDGSPLKSGSVILKLKGPASKILASERTLLNLIQRMSGVATATKKMTKSAMINALLKLNSNLDRNKIYPCTILMHPTDWDLKDKANFDHREGRSHWGKKAACKPEDKPRQKKVVAKKEKPADTPPVPFIETETPMVGPGPFAAAGLVAEVGTAPKGRGKIEGGPILSETLDLISLKKGDIVAYNNAKGKLMRGTFQKYAPKTGKIQLKHLASSPKPLYAIEAKSVRQITRGGKILDMGKYKLFKSQTIPLRYSPRATMAHAQGELHFLRTRLSPEQLAKVQKVLSPQAINKVDGLKLTRTQVIQLADDLAKNPEYANIIDEVLKNPAKYAKYAKWIRQFSKYGTLAFVCVVVYGLANTKNKTDYLMQTAAGTGGFVAGFKTVGVTASKLGLKHPLVLLGVSLLGGVTGAFGADKLYTEYVLPQLEKNFPNRNHEGDIKRQAYRGVEGAAFFTAGSWLNIADFTLDKIGVIGSVDEETEPLNYLSKTSKFFNMSNPEKGIFSDYLIRDPRRLAKEARETYDEYMSKGKKKEAKALEKFFKKDKEGKYLWVSETLERLYGQEQLLDIITASFAIVAGDKYSRKGQKFITNFAKRMKNKQILVKDSEKAMWNHINKQKIDVGGQPMTFIDYISFFRMHETQKKQMRDIFGSKDRI